MEKVSFEFLRNRLRQTATTEHVKIEQAIKYLTSVAKAVKHDELMEALNVMELRLHQELDKVVNKKIIKEWEKRNETAKSCMQQYSR